MTPSLLIPPTVALLLASCAPEFAPAAELSGLRVLAVQKNAPYAQPGQTVTLHMLWASDTTGAQQQPPQIAWFALCDNPPGDLYSLCFEQIAELNTTDSEDIERLATRVSLPVGEDPDRANDTFEFTVPEDILSARSNSARSGPVPYGVSYVFFAACAGTLGQDSSLPLPVVCFRELDGLPGLTSGDQRLGPESFVVGYTAVYSYETVRNTNPDIEGFEVAGQRLVADSSPARDRSQQEAIPVANSQLCVGTDCSSDASATLEAAGVPCPRELTFPFCKEQCEAVEVRALISPTTVERDEVATQLADTELQEQMWVNYYASSGHFEGGDIKLLNDATTGWNARSGVRYVADGDREAAVLWAVAHDNRGGSQWGRLRLCTEPAPQ